MIGRCVERGSGISVLAALHDDDDDDEYQLFYLILLTCLLKVKWSQVLLTNTNCSIQHYSFHLHPGK